MIKNYDPREGKVLSILNEDGVLIDNHKDFPLMNKDQIKEAYNFMLKTRLADEWAVSLNRQGRMPTYAPNMGQEANSLGAVMALREDDWVVPAFREMAGMLYRGIPLNQLYLYWLGNEMGSSYDVDKFHTLPLCVPLSSQTLHAVGLSYADKFKGSDRVAVTFIGDGATSEGDFYEAINFAGSWNVGTIFFVQNNQWAISTPTKMQTATNTIAEKAYAGGFDGIKVDGNDIFAVYAATKLAADKARSEGGPTLIEGFTYRLGAHTTADDPTRYRKEEDVEKWRCKDPITRLEKYIIAQKVFGENEIKVLKEKLLSEVKVAFEEADKYESPTLEDTFKYTYKEFPALLSDQIKEIKDNGKGEV